MRIARKLTPIAVALGAVVAASCVDSTPTGPPAGARVLPFGHTASIVSPTVWDFVALAGGEGPQGPAKTFTISGQGSVVATVSATQPNHGFESYSKGSAEPVGSDERGLGLCGYYGLGGACITQNADNEIGDAFTDDVTGQQTVLPSLYLDFTGLVAGSIVTSVTLSSVQLTEGYSVSWSSDGSNYTLVSAGTGGSSSSAVLSLDVPPATKYLRFDAGPGGAGNDYLVASATVQPPEANNGKTFSIGPSSMEGAILISNGDWVNGGYSFKFVNGTHIATSFTVHATVTLSGPCIGGGPVNDTFTFALNDATYSVPANNTDWLPTGDANSVLSWQGSVVASGVCGGIGKLDARHGAVYTATVSQNPSTGSLVNFRFKYRDPKAKGKPNTNCLDTSDPNRAKADVCGASWSQTVRDP